MTLSVTMGTSAGIPETSAAVKPSCVDDATLIEQFLRTSDEALFEVLVRRYQGKIFRLAASILGPGTDTEAEDAAQEVLVRVFRQLKGFRRESQFSTWLYRVARNHIIDYRRRAVRRTPELSDAALQNVPDSSEAANPQEALTTDQRRAWLRGQVGQLSEPQRTVVYLHYWQGQSVAEISELLDLKPGTVKSHLCRARQSLAVSLRESGCDG